jgi:hypothetical protein
MLLQSAAATAGDSIRYATKMTLRRQTSLDGVTSSAGAPSAPRQRRRLDTERTNGQLDPMPVAAFHGEVTPMGPLVRSSAKRRVAVECIGLVLQPLLSLPFLARGRCKRCVASVFQIGFVRGGGSTRSPVSRKTCRDRRIIGFTGGNRGTSHTGARALQGLP